VVVDLKMPGFNEYDAILKIRADYPHIKIVVFSGYLTPENQQQIKEMGVNWSISKTEGTQQIITVFNSVMEGKSYHSDVSFCIDAAIFNDDTNGNLTLREKQILMLISQGKTSREIGRVLCISKATVDKHRSNIKEKLGLKNIAEMVRYALNLN
jgi:two-component system nitrate/nitrite response regulator NarL